MLERRAQRLVDVVELVTTKEIEMQEATILRLVTILRVAEFAESCRSDPAPSGEDSGQAHPAGVEVVVAVPAVESCFVARGGLDHADPGGADVEVVVARGRHLRWSVSSADMSGLQKSSFEVS